MTGFLPHISSEGRRDTAVQEAWTAQTTTSPRHQVQDMKARARRWAQLAHDHLHLPHKKKSCRASIWPCNPQNPRNPLEVVLRIRDARPLYVFHRVATLGLLPTHDACKLKLLCVFYSTWARMMMNSSGYSFSKSRKGSFSSSMKDFGSISVSRARKAMGAVGSFKVP